MQRAVKLLGGNALVTGAASSCECVILNAVYTQNVRWKRKPIWLPTAKSKMFRVPQRPVIPMEEYVELKRLNNNYKTYMKSLKNYFEEVVKDSQVQFDQDVVKQAEEEDFLRCTVINDSWNKAVAKDRELRLAKEREERQSIILQKLLDKEQRDLKLKEQINEEIRRAKREAPTFITAANIDQAIQEALENIVDHNSAIDLEGNVYKGSAPLSKREKQITETVR